MLQKTTKDLDLAAVLLFVQGESVPHRAELEEKARAVVQELNNRESVLKHVIALCDEPQIPKERYLVEKAYAWLGRDYRKELIRIAEAYLAGAPWDELPSGTVIENGIKVHHDSVYRASVILDLAVALQEEGYLEAALSHFMAAYRLEPHNALIAIKAADVIAKQNGREEALRFLIAQRESVYYTPVRYKDSIGNIQHNDAFKQLLNAHILKMEDE